MKVDSFGAGTHVIWQSKVACRVVGGVHGSLFDVACRCEFFEPWLTLAGM